MKIFFQDSMIQISFVRFLQREIIIIIDQMFIYFIQFIVHRNFIRFCLI